MPLRKDKMASEKSTFLSLYVDVHALFIPAFFFIREASPSVPATVAGLLLTAQRRA